MGTPKRRWAAATAVAAYVFALLLGLPLLFEPDGTGFGPDRDRRGVDGPLPPLPTVVEQAFTLDAHTAQLLGYRVTDRRLTLEYLVKTVSCNRLVVEPDLSETKNAVSVLLRRVPAPEMKLF